jgi:hypothetical protein
MIDIKNKIDIIGKKLEVVKSKTLGFMAVAGGSWVYAVRGNDLVILNFGIWLVFALSVYGIIINFVKFGTLYKELERLENDTI